MGRFFNLDSPFVAFMNRVADLMILNVLFVICCIPVITIGPAVTALYYVTLKMARNEESYIAKSYFKSFKQNFRQGLVMWLIDLLLIGIFVLDFSVLNGRITGVENPGTPMFTVVRVILMVLAFLMLFAFSFTFPVLAKFDNTIKNTYRNAFLMSIRHFPTALVTTLLWGVVLLSGYLFPQVIIAHLLILFSLAAFISSFLFVKAFDNYIPKEEETEEEGLEKEIEAADTEAPEVTDMNEKM
ncbi:MAG: YesL family protein [Lachnospiraceae bacterium]|nr:YesL family protein [Lachnospiraceae bacterium]